MEIMQEPKMIRVLKWCVRQLILLLAFLMLLSALIMLGLLYLRSQALPPHQLHETTTIYAADGQVLDKIYQGENRTYVPIERIPPQIIQATIAVEDQRFFQHLGLDWRRIAGAALVNIKDMAYAEGASTITQQLARNLYLNHEKTWKRKLKEALYSVQLEMHFSKTEIMEQYLNQIYFGHSAYGVQAAAQLFFGKSVEDLSLAESALLVGVPKGPRYYSPWLNMENAKSRQKLILELMHEQGFISEQELKEALAEEVVILDPDAQPTSAEQAPYFRDYIQYLVTTTYGIDEEIVQRGGLRIYTTLDPVMQDKAEEIFKKYLPVDQELQGALVAIDPRTGYLKAMVGGSNYETSQYNRVFAARQPGSAIKPFLYYAALEQGLTPLTLMKSEPTTFIYDQGRATYTPRNFNDSYPHDFITMERAIAKSDNIYAVKTLLHLGEETFIATLQRFGLQRDFQPLPSLALGAQNVSLFELVRGYSILANQGNYLAPTALTRIEDNQGNVIIQENKKATQVLDPVHTFILNKMLQSVFEAGGTGYRVANLLQRPVAGKTGSTDTDAWMVGYTPQLVAGVWTGYDQGRLLNHNNDGRLALQIWAEFLEESLTEEVF